MKVYIYDVKYDGGGQGLRLLSSSGAELQLRSSTCLQSADYIRNKMKMVQIESNQNEEKNVFLLKSRRLFSEV